MTLILVRFILFDFINKNSMLLISMFLCFALV